MHIRTVLGVLATLMVACGNGSEDDPLPQAVGGRPDTVLAATAEPVATSAADGTVGIPTSPDSAPASAESRTLPPGCIPDVARLPGNSPEASFQFWCKREPAGVFQAWRDGDEAVSSYGPRWAIEVCAEESPWHAELLGYFLELPLERAYLERLWGLVRGAVASCGDPRAAEWLRAGLATDLAPDLRSAMVRTALSLGRPEWDSTVVDAWADRSRETEARIRDLEQYVVARLDISEVPTLVAEGYASQRLPRGFISKWVPALLARGSTRDDMATLGIEGLLGDSGNDLADEFAWVLFTEMNAYAYRFPEPLVQRGEAAFQRMAENGRRASGLSELLPEIAAARRDSLNSARQPVRHVPWTFVATEVDGLCVPQWPDRLRDFADSTVAGLRIVSRRGECPGPHQVGDFDADGSDDVVMMGVLDEREVWILILAGTRPQVIEFDPIPGYDQVFPVDPGWYMPYCAEEPVWMPWSGFAIGFAEDRSNLYHVQDGRLVEQPRDLCEMA